jgi:hypothetical protein
MEFDQNEIEAYEYFKRRYSSCYPNDDYGMARVLSGRLRELDKRVKATNKRNEELQAEVKRLTSLLQSPPST